MNTEKLIRISIVIQWVLIILSIIIYFIEERHLQPLLKEYLLLKDNAEQSNVEFIGMFLGVVALIAYFIASIGILKFKRWSRSLYLWSNILGILFIPLFLGVTIMTPFSYVFDEGATLFIGITIAFLYFSEAKEHFNKTSNMPMN